MIASTMLDQTLESPSQKAIANSIARARDDEIPKRDATEKTVAQAMVLTTHGFSNGILPAFVSRRLRLRPLAF